ncbi:hypothetical protein BU16DRAFT_528417 [Lophium mytilinum]|uniref:Uncharacterized protein n=1 Tax=Lophium mytilinum TaxID=390894 RepID=A0A6A6QTR0_9PEZI|nr:hypothetical protein BU16DRAFT_528417 [Lophium mytilinum]
MADYPRRASSAIPPPPPLPPAKQHLGQPRSYFSRFVTQPFSTYGSRPTSAQKTVGRPNPLVPRLPGISSGSSQDASHKTGLDISALDMNRERTHAIIAGRDILKTIRVKDAKCAEDINLRAAIINYAAHNTRHRETMEIHDVKWSHGQFSTHIATAATNGKVILYDLNRAGMELARLHEHHRQVHKVAFNPHQGYLLLSGSQDATVRLWDLRDMRKDVMTCPSRDKFAGLSEGIRDLQWSPTDGVEFAFGTDNGVIQRWDFRHAKGPKLKINAHEQKICTSIDWHPDGKHLLSASTDRTVKIWDFSSDTRRQKPAFVLRTPYPVHKARWRPPHWSDDFHDQGAYQCTQLATSYDRDHPVVHLWDFRRPFLPFREISRFNSAPSDMLWHSRDFLWTVGREGVFAQTDVHFSPKVVDRRNLQAIAVSPTGEVGGFVQKRPRRRRSGLEYASVDDSYTTDREKRSSPEKNSLRSSADDSVDESFLSSSFRRHHGRTSSNRSTRSFGSTPPSSDVAPKVMFLTESMELLGDSMMPNQVGFRGALPGSMSIQVFTYLAQKYKSIPLPDPPTLESYYDLYRVFEQNAEYAERAAFYRLAQSWRIIGGTVAVTTLRRAERHKKRRIDDKRLLLSDAQLAIVKDATAAHGRPGGIPNPAVRAIYGPDKEHHHAPPESTSNLATPLARPYQDTKIGSTLPSLPDPDRDENLSLPPAAVGPHSQEERFLSPETANKPSGPRRPSFNGPLWNANSLNDLDERRAQIGSWRAAPRAPLILDPPSSQGISIAIPPRLDRHDSDESFAMFSASTDSQRGISVSSSFASSKSHARSMGSIPEKWQQQDTSSFGNSQPTQSSQLGQQEPGHSGLTGSFGRSVDYSPTTKPVGAGTNEARPVEQLGTGRSDTDRHLEYASRDKAIQDIETLRRNNQLFRHDSSDSEAFSRDGLSEVSADIFHENMEASGTIVPDGPFDDVLSPQSFRPTAGLTQVDSTPPAVDPLIDEPILLSDFQAADIHEPSETLTVLNLLRQTLQFHTDTLSDAQTSSLLILLLSPLLPRTCHSATDPATLATYADHLSTLGLSPTQIDTILSTRLTPLLETGLNPYQAEAVLSTYHAQLHALGLFNAAASLRRLAYPLYPAVYEQALKDTQLGLLCLSCKSPINNPRDKMRCETCRRAQAPCPVCWGAYPAFEGAVKAKKARLRSSAADVSRHRKRSSVLLPSFDLAVSSDAEELSPSVPEAAHATPRAVLWTWCPLCGHGGHTACLSAWFADAAMAEGACATEGCLCDCVPGPRREKRVREGMGKKAERERTRPVRGDEWRVGESKAVGAASRVLAPVGGEGQASGKGEGSGRRVRVVVPVEKGGRFAVGEVER